jgi:hypothetical protein
VVLFFSLSTGKRGLYILPALPALIVAASAHLPALFQRPAVQRVSLGLAAILVLPAVLLSVALLIEHPRAMEFIAESELVDATPILVFAAVAGSIWLWAWRSQKTLWAWPGVLVTLTTVWGLMAAPQLNPIRSASAFMATVQAQVADDEHLGLLAYKEQFLLHLDRDIVNFGHARWREGDAEAYDAARWLVAQPERVLLVPDYFIETCFNDSEKTALGTSSRFEWFLVRGTADSSCVAQGNDRKAITYPMAIAQ